MDLKASKVVPATLPATVFSATPDLEFTNYEVVDRWLDPVGGIRLNSKWPNDQEEAKNYKVKIVLARFYYKPDRGVPRSMYVKAHLAFANAQGLPIRTRYDAIWDTEQENEYKQFDTADTYGLIIAVLIGSLKGCEVTTFRYNERDGEFHPEWDNLEGREFRLRLELIGKYENEAVMNKPLELSLSLDPEPTLKLL